MRIMEISRHFDTENYLWRLSIVQNLCDLFSCVIFGPKMTQNPNSHTIPNCCIGRRLTSKSNDGGGKEKFQSYLRGLINTLLKTDKIKQTDRQTDIFANKITNEQNQTNRPFGIENYTCIFFYAKLSFCLFVCLSVFFHVSFSMPNCLPFSSSICLILSVLMCCKWNHG